MTAHEIPRPRWVPSSTYRLQLQTRFRFSDAEAIVPYLAKLGISDCYSSPYLTARPGSTHGYDICNHNALNPELGTEEEYRAFHDALRSLAMGLLVDFVPNHMGIDPGTNPWWHDVLENGSCSAFARFFDIDWEPVVPHLAGKVLLPILGDQYGHVLERGELRLGFEDGTVHLDYFEHRLPVNPRQAIKVYRYGIEELQKELDNEDPHLREFLSIITALHNMPAYTESDPEKIAERRREKEVSRERLKRLVEAAPRIGRHIEDAIRLFNGEPGRPESFDLLHDLLEVQPYRLAYWRTAAHEINYRRFFDINELAALRMEDPEVFEATHQLTRRLLAEGRISGLRLDHPDGLFDPGRYFERVQELAAEVWAPPDDVRPEWTDARRPLYLLAEKILSGNERLPSDWRIHGTTGYNFLNDLNGLFIDQGAARALRRIYSRFTGRDEPFEEVGYGSKKLIMETSLSSELNVLAQALERLAEGSRRSRDFTLNSLRGVLQEVVACLPVYRTYITEAGWRPADREVIETAVRLARRRNPAMESSIFDFLREVLLPRQLDSLSRSAEDRRIGYPPADPREYGQRLYFSMKFQQYTGPVQAKGLEDTAFYRYNLLISLNEVGGDPGRFGRSPGEFHAANQARLEDWPFEMVATATHDTKLGEDVRARINTLAELPEEWRRELTRWSRLNANSRRMVDGEWAPDRNDEYRFYQVLLGAWPAELTEGVAPEASTSAPSELIARLREYMLKAIREAKVHTSWINANKAYEDAVAAFVERSLAGSGASRFLAAVLPFQARVARLGMVNSLAQTVLKIASPGVPDFYQGTEFWDLRLVDPDNRHPVDFHRRQSMLEELWPLLCERGADVESGSDAAGRPAAVADMLGHWHDGRIKLLITACGLRLRRTHPELFLTGEYRPLEPDLTVPAGIVAFMRRQGNEEVLAIVPRLAARLTAPDRPFPLGAESWRTSRVLLPPDSPWRTYRHLFTGEEIRVVTHRDQSWIFVGEAFRTCPVALLRPAQ